MGLDHKVALELFYHLDIDGSGFVAPVELFSCLTYEDTDASPIEVMLGAYENDDIEVETEQKPEGWTQENDQVWKQMLYKDRMKDDFITYCQQRTLIDIDNVTSMNIITISHFA